MISEIIFFICIIPSATALNYFWLSWDPNESARLYCDQHCFKIGSEVVESIWDVVMTICPELNIKADDLGLTKANRKRRHSRVGTLWHPLSVWHGLCFSNMHRGLINADAIFREHYTRTGTKHSAWKDCLFLLKYLSLVSFTSKEWEKWYLSQNGEIGTMYTPAKSKKKDLEKRREWCGIHAFNILEMDREGCPMTEPPQCMEPHCKVPGDTVRAYRKYYQNKLYTMGIMRYYHKSPIPSWIFGFVIDNDGKIKIIPYQLDEEGYVVVELRK